MVLIVVSELVVVVILLLRLVGRHLLLPQLLLLHLELLLFDKHGLLHLELLLLLFLEGGLSHEVLDDLDGGLPARVVGSLEEAAVALVVGLSGEVEGWYLAIEWLIRIHRVQRRSHGLLQMLPTHRPLLERVDRQERVRTHKPRIRIPLTNMDRPGSQILGVELLTVS